MRTHRLAFTVGEMNGASELRVPVRGSNTLVSFGMFEDVKLETGRGRVDRKELTEIRARAAKGRVVTLSPRYLPGDMLAVSFKFVARGKRQDFRVVAVHGKRVRDYLGRETFNPAGWSARHTLAEWERNPWCWCITVRRVRGG